MLPTPLSHLIQQAKNSRRINDIFKTESLAFDVQADADQGFNKESSDPLQTQLASLETLLFDNATAYDSISQEIIRELELIASDL